MNQELLKLAAEMRTQSGGHSQHRCSETWQAAADLVEEFAAQWTLSAETQERIARVGYAETCAQLQHERDEALAARDVPDAGLRAAVERLFEFEISELYEHGFVCAFCIARVPLGSKLHEGHEETCVWNAVATALAATPPASEGQLREALERIANDDETSYLACPGAPHCQQGDKHSEICPVAIARAALAGGPACVACAAVHKLHVGSTPATLPEYVTDRPESRLGVSDGRRTTTRPPLPDDPPGFEPEDYPLHGTPATPAESRSVQCPAGYEAEPSLVMPCVLAEGHQGEHRARQDADGSVFRWATEAHGTEEGKE